MNFHFINHPQPTHLSDSVSYINNRKEVYNPFFSLLQYFAGSWYPPHRQSNLSVSWSKRSYYRNHLYRRYDISYLWFTHIIPIDWDFCLKLIHMLPIARRSFNDTVNRSLERYTLWVKVVLLLLLLANESMLSLETVALTNVIKFC